MTSLKTPFLILCLVSLFLTSCNFTEKQNVEIIFINGTVYTCDSAFSTHTAIAIDSGIVVGIGTVEDIESHYKSDQIYDLNGAAIYPGLIDAHSHFFGFGKDLQELDLKNTSSFEDMINKTVEYGEKTNPQYIIGRGWNEEDWVVKGTISKLKLDILFPNTPVFLQRIDGHAALCNQAALDLAGIDEYSIIEGGKIEKMGPFLTGILVDKAADKVMDLLPEPSLSQKIVALQDAEKACYAAGLTAVTDAGLDYETILLIDSLHHSGALTIPIYVMANPDTIAINKLLQNTSIKNNAKLQFTSVKLYADGSLGSRGALLKKPYCDDSTWNGHLQSDVNYFKTMIDYCYRNNLQVNTHCIGDSANKLLLQLYAEKLGGKNDRRWRIEHAQVVSPSDIHYFTDFDIIPSIQPTHATSDAEMAQKRLCTSTTMDGAYIYKTLLSQTGLVALGTDFPVEDIDPLSTFFAAVKRKTKNGDVFKPGEALTPQNTLLGMTKWAAYSCMWDNEFGSLQTGMPANLTITSKDMMTAYDRGRIVNAMTMVNGKIVYTNNNIKVVAKD